MLIKARHNVGFVFCFLLLCGQWACGGGASPTEGQQPGQGQAAEAWIEVRQPRFKLREEPGMDARAIQGLQPGARALTLGEQSPFTTRLELGGRVYNEPWLLVRLENGKEGWVYGLAFTGSPEGEEELPAGVRLRSLFGGPLAGQIALYREALEQARSAEAIIQAMDMGCALRDTLVQALALRAFEDNQQESLFWLKDAIPAFVPHLKDDGFGYHLFLDYRPFLALAQASEGAADDALLELCLMAYPEDSIEYFYPAWKFQAGEGQVHSLLGRGLHFSFLKELDQLLVYQDVAGEMAGRFRRQLLNDITGADVTYWESREKAAAELEQITKAQFRALSEEEQKALEARLLQFGNPEKYDIRFNYRSGIYNLE